jgi:hypothetical protein
MSLVSRADIVTILNADVILRHAFVRRIVSHCQAGADDVQEPAMQWTEAFSCRRAATGLFPQVLPLMAGEPGRCGDSLATAGLRKVLGPVLVALSWLTSLAVAVGIAGATLALRRAGAR